MNKIFKFLGLALLACTLTLTSCGKDPETPSDPNNPENPENPDQPGETSTIAQGTFTLEGTYPGWPIACSGLDFNNDGELEFRVYENPMNGLDYGYIIFSYSETDLCSNLTTNWDEVAPVSEGEIIDANASFTSFGDASLSDSPATQYIGFRILLDGQIHYGWTKVVISGTHADWCEVYYNKTPNAPITVGQKQ